MRSARREDCEASRLALDLICRMFTVSSIDSGVMESM
jgi:hypothetical protein